MIYEQDSGEKEAHDAYRRGEGGMMWAQAGYVIADHLAHQKPLLLQPVEAEHINDPLLGSAYQPVFELSVSVTRDIVRRWRYIPSDRAKVKAYRQAGMKISEKDYDAAVYTGHAFGGGFEDPDFTVHFATGALFNILREAVQDNIIPGAEVPSIGLLDYADCFSAGWFSTFAHHCTATKIATWGGFGSFTSGYNYPERSISTLTEESDSESLRFTEFSAVTTEAGNRYIPRTSKELRHALHARLRKPSRFGSSGCPVARKNYSAETRKAQKRAIQLEKMGVGTLVDSHEKEQFVVTETPIDRMLLAWAAYLRTYVELHGEPKAQIEDGQITFDHTEPQESMLDRYLVL